MRVRRQVYELTTADLDEFPVWEFALDEEGEPDQDEATVRPWQDALPLDPNEGMFVVRAGFLLADGTRLVGYLTPPVQGDDSIGTVQPIVVTPDGQVGFWCGLMAQSGETLAANYAKLGRAASAVFPLRYASEVEIESGPITGTVDGFMHYRSLDDRTVVEVR
jgi:hypothetical protein